MILPNPAMDFDPLDVLTAAELDDLVENDQAIASGLNDGTALTSIRKNNLTIDSNPYKFRVSRNAAANTGNGAFLVINFDTEQYDTNNNVSSGVYTVPVSGFYQFNFGASVSTGGTDTIVVSLFKNGTETSRGGQIVASSGAVFGVVGTDLIQLSATDTVDIRSFASVTRALSVGQIYGNFFSGFLVSRT